MGGYVSQLLGEYAAAPSRAWRSKDAALYLVLAVAVKGRTGERGATTTNKLVNVDEFFTQQVGGVGVESGGGEAGAGCGLTQAGITRQQTPR
jgi:hypothetical protein